MKRYRLSVFLSVLLLGLFVLTCRTLTKTPSAGSEKTGADEGQRSGEVDETVTVAAESPVAKVRGAVGGVIGAVLPSSIVHSANSAAYAEEPSRESYAAISESKFIDTIKDAISTFAIDVDRASYSNIRRFLTSGQLPPADAVRIEEMVNYFSYEDPEPSGGRPFSISSEVASCPWKPEDRLIRIGIRGKKIEEWKLQPNNLVFLIDVSGSMMPPDRLPLLKSSFRMLVENLRPTDQISIVVYAGAAGVVLPPTPGSDKTAILDAIEGLEAGGSTAGGEGILLAYKIARENYLPEGNNRVILATDGDFNVGVSSEQDLEELIVEKRKEGVFLTVLGVGTGNLQDSKMELLADKGNGNYAYLDSVLEARKVLVEEFGGTLVTIARDVKIQVEFDPAQVRSYRLVGYENRMLATEDFNDDTKDAGELGSGHFVTALYQITPQAGARGTLASLRLRYKEPKGERSQLVETKIIDGQRSFEAASADLKFAAAVAAFGMMLRDSPERGTFTLEEIMTTAKIARGVDLAGHRGDFVQLLEGHRSLLQSLDRRYVARREW